MGRFMGYIRYGHSGNEDFHRCLSAEMMVRQGDWIWGTNFQMSKYMNVIKIILMDFKFLFCFLLSGSTCLLTLAN